MAVITHVTCRSCGAKVDYKDAKLLRVYTLASRLSYRPHDVKVDASVCNSCYNTIRKMLRMRVDKDAN